MIYYDDESRIGDILAVPANGLSGAGALTVGQEIRVPNPARLPRGSAS